jgi:hypothetical protein
MIHRKFKDIQVVHLEAIVRVSALRKTHLYIEFLLRKSPSLLHNEPQVDPLMPGILPILYANDIRKYLLKISQEQ